MLEIKDLHASVDGTEILRGLNLTIQPGSVHAVMGPNGSGKSTLAKVIAGHPDYEITSGSITYEHNFKKIDLMELEPYERAHAGIFLAFQYPVALPGVTNSTFLRASFDAVCKSQGLDPMSDDDFSALLTAKCKLVAMDESFLSRPVNDGFSGGEKKRNEILQMALLSPQLALLDETDSGLDIDSLRIIAEGVNKLRGKRNSFVIITHYQRLLDHIEPDHVHVLWDGRIVKSGDKSLALELEKRGYDWVKAEAA